MRKVHHIVPPLGLNLFSGCGSKNLHHDENGCPVADNQERNQSQGEPVLFVCKPNYENNAYRPERDRKPSSSLYLIFPRHTSIIESVPKRSRTGKPDVNQMASNLIDAISGDLPAEQSENGKNPAAVLLGRLGGMKGGKARAKALSARKRVQIARKAAAARWGKR